ncbi:hypothetical protein ACFYRD_26520 [Streptomyces hirsutus]|uniref:hypothetical protein n=1 Tax=Streptomyces hirsutus TaxID=35620 RepID=UPI0036ABFE54
MATSHDMTTPGAGAISRLNTARMQQGSTDNADRLIAERRAASSAVSHSDAMQDVYAERSAAREAEQREAEEYRDAVENSHEWRDRHSVGERFDRDNPRPRVGSPDDLDFLKRMAEESAWLKRRDEYLQRAEGEELAARIFRR